MPAGLVVTKRGILQLCAAGVFDGNKINRFLFTKADTLGLTAAQVALEHLFVGLVVVHGPKRAGADTGAAADTDAVVDRQVTQCFIVTNGAHRTDGFTGYYFT